MGTYFSNGFRPCLKARHAVHNRDRFSVKRVSVAARCQSGIPVPSNASMSDSCITCPILKTSAVGALSPQDLSMVQLQLAKRGWLHPAAVTTCRGGGLRLRHEDLQWSQAAPGCQALWSCGGWDAARTWGISNYLEAPCVEAMYSFRTAI